VDESSFIVVTRRKFAWAFNVSPVVEERRQTGPTLLAHAIAFVQNHDAAQNHGAHQRRCHVAQTARAFDYRRNEKIFRTRVQCGLHDEHVAAHPLPRRIRQGRLPHARFADQPGAHRDILFGYDHPGGQQMPHQLFLPDPTDGQFIGMGEVKGNSFDLDCHGLFNCSGP
jgi:hypothetical protein